MASKLGVILTTDPKWGPIIQGGPFSEAKNGHPFCVSLIFVRFQGGMLVVSHVGEFQPISVGVPSLKLA